MLSMRSTYHRIHSQLLRSSIIAGACVALLCAGSARASTLIVRGAGDGHGVGMSQEGALGYAEHGFTYQAILAHYYPGTALGQAPANMTVRVLIGGTVHKLSLENYVRGVIAAEMPSSWPLAALQAQAVAVRTYVLTAHAGGARFDVYSDTRSQVYRGVAAETSRTNAAALATAGQIVTYHGQPAITYFYASSGGHTENVQNAFPGSASEPWLLGVPDPYDQGPLHSWTLSLSFAAVAKDLSGLLRGDFRGIEVLRRGVSPRILSASILCSGGRVAISGGELASRLGLYDTWAYFSVKHGTSESPEPDRSGQSAASSPVPASGAPAGAGGGAQGPAGAPAAATGGAVAG
jgi:stage II sporulation protein D